MSDKKKVDAPSCAEDSERTLVALDQLSQTIEVMSREGRVAALALRVI